MCLREHRCCNPGYEIDKDQPSVSRVSKLASLRSFRSPIFSKLGNTIKSLLKMKTSEK